MNNTSKNKILKRILGIGLMALGVILFISLYVMVILSQENYIKYIVTVTGYISVIVFLAKLYL